MSRFEGIGIGPNLDPGLEVERIEGNLTYVKGHSYPFKNAPTLEQIEILNIFKGLFRFKLSAAIDALEYVLKYDWAYKVRFLDLCNETTTELLHQNPRKEIKRLTAINKERDYKVANGELVSDKVQNFAKILRFLLLFPPFKRKFKELAINLPKPDEIDKYWMRLRTDYKSGV